MTPEKENEVLRRAVRETQGRLCPRWHDPRQWSAYKQTLQRLLVESDKEVKGAKR